ncbi:TetR/AcrR family transcriptional regulator [Qipengyuania sp.]|uniref:TetR/AcrR family transcriptional regulator n=1 Tax=Qipengyuania sp. TaxID=2004515 RepID=UPI0035C83ED5
MSEQATEKTKTRRTQADRTADTRRRALDATIRCLARDGYAATTTVRVAQEAGISRGGMLHHFPTRADLLSETLKDIEMTLRRKRGDALSSLPADIDMFVALTRIGWESYQSEEAMALIELTIAARGDDDLAAALRKTHASVHGFQLEGSVKVARHVGIENVEMVEAMHLLHTAAMRGLLIEQSIGIDPARVDAAIDLLVLYKEWFAQRFT